MDLGYLKYSKKKYEEYRDKDNVYMYIQMGRVYYEHQGRYVEADTYIESREQGDNTQSVFDAFGESVILEMERRHQQETKGMKHIRNINELVQYIFTILTPEQRKKINEGTTLQEKKHLLPDVYKNIIKMYNAHAKTKKAHLETLYNPDQFIGE